jgi:hypothetical protein
MAAVYSDEKILGKVQIGNTSSIVVKTYKRDGSPMVSIRKFIEAPGYTGFSKEGVDFTPQQAKEITAALMKILAEGAQ